MAARMLGTLRLLGTERAMVFSGDDGLDELTTTTTSTVHELADGAVHSYSIDPLDLGIARADTAQLMGGDATVNARMLRAVLAGEKGPHRDLAALNAAAALVVAGIANDLASGFEAANAALDIGAAERALDDLVRVSGAARAAESEA
jgi:anthranilate phosphoribosyltransferase